MRVLTGAELEALSQEQLKEVVRDVDVYARTSPEHKIRIVRALQAHDEVVAMTGDGVNDAPALTRANVGIAMGIKGTEATKEAAEIVLADDNFATIRSAIARGAADLRQPAQVGRLPAADERRAVARHPRRGGVRARRCRSLRCRCCGSTW